MEFRGLTRIAKALQELTCPCSVRIPSPSGSVPRLARHHSRGRGPRTAPRGRGTSSVYGPACGVVDPRQYAARETFLDPSLDPRLGWVLDALRTRVVS